MKKGSKLDLKRIVKDEFSMNLGKAQSIQQRRKSDETRERILFDWQTTDGSEAGRPRECTLYNKYLSVKRKYVFYWWLCHDKF